MRVLCHGDQFYFPLELYEGPHELRRLSATQPADYTYDPSHDTAADVIDRVRREWAPDLLLFWTVESYLPPFEVEKCPIPTVAMVSDWNVVYPMFGENLSRFDVVLCDKAGVEILGGPRVNAHHLFPLYCQNSLFHKPRPVAKDIDVIMLGNMNHAAHPLRARYIERLAKLSCRYRVVLGEGLSGDAYGEMLNRARIVFNHSIRGELNLRIFETLASGSLAFIEEDNHEVRDWFEDGREVVFYNDENFEEKVGYYLAHEDEAVDIAQRGLARAHEFAGENRLTALIDRAAALVEGERSFLELPADERVYQNLLFYVCALWPQYHALEQRLLLECSKQHEADPRFWTLLGRHMIVRAQEEPQCTSHREGYLKAFRQAHRLCGGSVVYALNAARGCELFGQRSEAADLLQAALSAKSVDGADMLIGGHGDAFWVRWIRAVAEKRARVEMLHAAAHIRLANIFAEEGHLEHAQNALRAAADLDSENPGGRRLESEILWSQDRKVEAAEFLHRHLPEMPFDFEVRDRLGVMWTELGAEDEASELREESAHMRKALLAN